MKRKWNIVRLREDKNCWREMKPNQVAKKYHSEKYKNTELSLLINQEKSINLEMITGKTNLINAAALHWEMVDHFDSKNWTGNHLRFFKVTVFHAYLSDTYVSNLKNEHCTEFQMVYLWTSLRSLWTATPSPHEKDFIFDFVLRGGGGYSQANRFVAPPTWDLTTS